MSAFAAQQRHLLAAFGVRMPASASLALTYARSAMATALPGGSAVSAGYAFRQFRSRGAGPPVAAAVMVLSGVVSTAGLALLFGADLVAWTGGPVPALALVAAGATAAWGAGRVRVVPADARPTDATLPEPATGASVPDRLRHALRQTAGLARGVPAGGWLRVFGMAVLNWLTDVACLVAAVHAVGLAVPTRTVVTAYLAAQLIRQIPVTPGGIGVIEASLVLALTGAGAAQAPAAAAVLIYRLLSCWAVLPIGLVCWTALKPPAERAGDAVARPQETVRWLRRRAPGPRTAGAGCA
jgi:uncharacterized membrane protein YbhN (UPF0104 family)